MLGSGRELRKRVPKTYGHADEDEPDEAKPRKRGRPSKEDRRSSAVRMPKRAAPMKLKPFSAPCDAGKLESFRVSFEQLPDDLQLRELRTGAADVQDGGGPLEEGVAHANGDPEPDSSSPAMPPPNASASSRPLPVPMPPAASAQLMQVCFFLHSFADALNLSPSNDDGLRSPPGLGVHELAYSMYHGDLSGTHRVHTILLTFIARASLSHAGYAEAEGDTDAAAECVQLDQELAREVLDASRVHNAWPELVRRVARKLRYPRASTLKALYFGEYHAIGVSDRMHLAAFLCDAALGTLAIRRVVNMRMERVEETEWDWEAAAAAGLVQNKPFHHLPRVEPLGHDRDHATLWPMPSRRVMRQGAEQEEESASCPREAALEYFEGSAGLNGLLASLDARGAREAALGTALTNFVGGAPAAPLPALPRAAQAAVPPAAHVMWPMAHKDYLPGPAIICPVCNRKLKVTPNDFAEHVCNCAASTGRPRASAMQRQAMRLLALELLVAPPFMRSSWADERQTWRARLVEAGSLVHGAAAALATLLIELERNIHPMLFRAGWHKPAGSGEAAASEVGGHLSVPGAAQGEAAARMDEERHVDECHVDEELGEDEVCDGDGCRLQLVRSSRAASGYKGVYAAQKAGQATRYEAHLHGVSLGLYETARAAAEAYARSLHSSQTARDGELAGAIATGARVRLALRCGMECAQLHDGSGPAAASAACRVRATLQVAMPVVVPRPDVAAAAIEAASRPARSTRASKQLAEPADKAPMRTTRSCAVKAPVDADADADSVAGQSATCCEICGGDEDDSKLMLCDGCDLGFHIYCLPRPMLQVPEGDWFCEKCSNAHAEAARVPFRVGCELRCKDEAGDVRAATMDAMGVDAVLVHYTHGLPHSVDEWVPIASGRLELAGGARAVACVALDDVGDDDDVTCEVCGSAEDSEQLLLCDSEGCEAAYHMTCLREPLESVPEGEWFCERCQERDRAGGSLSDTHGSLVRCAARWRWRVAGVRTCAHFALALGSLERAVRTDDQAAAVTRLRRGRVGQHGHGGLNVLDRRVGADGYFEYQVSRPQEHTCVVVVPENVQPGQQIVGSAPFGSFRIIVPPGVAPGQQLSVKVPASAVIPGDSAANGAGSGGEEPQDGGLAWAGLDQLGTQQLMLQIFDYEAQCQQRQRRELAEQNEIRHVVFGMVAQLERAEQQQRHLEMQRMRKQQQQQQQQWESMQRAHERDVERAAAERYAQEQQRVAAMYHNQRLAQAQMVQAQAVPAAHLQAHVAHQNAAQPHVIQAQQPWPGAQQGAVMLNEQSYHHTSHHSPHWYGQQQQHSLGQGVLSDPYDAAYDEGYDPYDPYDMHALHGAGSPGGVAGPPYRRGVHSEFQGGHRSRMPGARAARRGRQGRPREPLVITPEMIEHEVRLAVERLVSMTESREKQQEKLERLKVEKQERLERRRVEQQERAARRRAEQLERQEQRAKAEALEREAKEQRRLVEHQARKEQRARAEAEKQIKEAQRVEREVRWALNKVIRQVEKNNEKAHGRVAHDGELYVHNKGRKAWKVRGVAFKDYFRQRTAPLQRNEELEAEASASVDGLMKLVRPESKPPPIFGPTAKIEWVHPSEYDNNWGKIHLRAVA